MKKKITPTKYNKIMGDIIKEGEKKNWGIPDTLISLIEEASKYELKGDNQMKRGIVK